MANRRYCHLLAPSDLLHCVSQGLPSACPSLTVRSYYPWFSATVWIYMKRLLVCDPNVEKNCCSETHVCLCWQLGKALSEVTRREVSTNGEYVRGNYLQWGLSMADLGLFNVWSSAASFGRQAVSFNAGHLKPFPLVTPFLLIIKIYIYNRYTYTGLKKCLST